jgi:hypothetical protein
VRLNGASSSVVQEDLRTPHCGDSRIFVHSRSTPHFIVSDLDMRQLTKVISSMTGRKFSQAQHLNYNV